MLFEPRLKETGVQMFPTRFDTNRAVQSWKKIRSLKFRIKEEVQVCTIAVAKTKAQISCAVTAQLICAFVFAYACCWFSYAAVHIIYSLLSNIND